MEMAHKPINAFPGYEFKRLDDNKFHNMYRGVDLGKGGWVYTDPGIYSNVALLDISSMHPSSIIALNKLGEYTQRYADLKQARVYIKHGDYEAAGKLFDGKLKKYLTNKKTAKALSSALKLPLNAFFGQSFAGYDNPARDSRDENNIIALRGSLFMKTLFDEVEARGFHIVHVKTDSVKVPNATPEIIKFIQDFAKKYDYDIEHEATYERMCLIDKAQYIASYASEEQCVELYGYCPSENKDYIQDHGYTWTATGAEFQHPYIFKTLFSGESIVFDDLCETKTVKDAAMYLDMNEGYPNVEIFDKELLKRINNIENPDNVMKLNSDLESYSNEDLENKIAEGHNFIFIGRVGRFIPIKPGAGGGILLALRNGKYNSVNGTKDFRWLEAEVVKNVHKEGDRDLNYYKNLIDKAIKFIEQFGSFEHFIDISKPYDWKPQYNDPPGCEGISDDDLPFDLVPCGDGKRTSCLECPNLSGDICKRGYSLNSYVELGGGA